MEAHHGINQKTASQHSVKPVETSSKRLCWGLKTKYIHT